MEQGTDSHGWGHRAIKGDTHMTISAVRHDYVPDIMVRLPGAASPTPSVPARTSQVQLLASRTTGAVGGAVGGAAQLGTMQIAQVLQGLVEVLTKLVQLVQQMRLPGGGGSVTPPGGTPCPTPFSAGAQAASAPPASSGTGEDHAFEQRVIELVNQERARYGLRPLSYNAVLDRASESHNAVQVQTRTMAHKNLGDGDPGSRIRSMGYYGAWGENVAVGQRTPEQVVREWMNSPTHRANILNASFTRIGVAYGQTSDGHSFWTQTFGA
jgi:uncharacterized protein YkwD